MASLKIQFDGNDEEPRTKSGVENVWGRFWPLCWPSLKGVICFFACLKHRGIRFVLAFAAKNPPAPVNAPAATGQIQGSSSGGTER